MAFDAFLKLDGLDGESTRTGFEKWIEIYSFSMGAANTTNIGTSGEGAGAGKVVISGFNMMKKTDSTSPNMFAKCCGGLHYPKATVMLNKAGGDKSISYLKYEFTEVFVESIQWSGAGGGDDTPTESVELAFGSVKVTYTPQKADGTPGAAVIAGWNIKKNEKI